MENSQIKHPSSMQEDQQSHAADGTHQAISSHVAFLSAFMESDGHGRRLWEEREGAGDRTQALRTTKEGKKQDGGDDWVSFARQPIL